MKLRSCGIYIRVLAVGLLSIQMAFTGAVLAQSDEVQPNSRLQYLQNRPESDNTLTPQAEMSQGVLTEVPYSHVFKDTDEVDLFRETHFNTYNPRFGNGGGAKVNAGILSGNVSFPLTGRARFKVDDAELKLSNFYIDIRSISASFLYSDNENHSEFNRDTGTILGLRLDFAVLAPITERFKISAAGAVIYLPLQNRAGFALYDALKQFRFEPIFRSQIAYDLSINNWEVEFADDFSIEQIPLDYQISYSYFSGAFEDPVREGRYSYGGGAAGTHVFEDRSPYGRFDAGLIRAQNIVGGKVSRLLPTETRMEFGAYHADNWYLSGDTSVLGLPHSQDWAYASLRSERENLRFKPFVTYRVSKYDYYSDWQHDLRGGIEGPITKNISFYGAAGERWLYFGKQETIWQVRVRHQIGPYTSHSIEYGHETTEPDIDLRDRWIYRITQVIGDGMTLDLYGSHATFDDLDGTNTGSEDWRGGVLLTYRPSPRTTFILAGTYTSIDYTRPGGYDPQIWQGTAGVSHHFTPTFEAQVRYEYTDRDSKARGDSYYENFATVSLIKYF